MRPHNAPKTAPDQDLCAQIEKMGRSAKTGLRGSTGHTEASQGIEGFWHREHRARWAVDIFRGSLRPSASPRVGRAFALRVSILALRTRHVKRFLLGLSASRLRSMRSAHAPSARCTRPSTEMALELTWFRPFKPCNRAAVQACWRTMAASRRISPRVPVKVTVVLV